MTGAIRSRITVHLADFQLQLNWLPARANGGLTKSAQYPRRYRHRSRMWLCANMHRTLLSGVHQRCTMRVDFRDFHNVHAAMANFLRRELTGQLTSFKLRSGFPLRFCAPRAPFLFASTAVRFSRKVFRIAYCTTDTLQRRKWVVWDRFQRYFVLSSYSYHCSLCSLLL